MAENPIPPCDDDEAVHRAANDALAISIGVEVLRAIPDQHLTPAQVRAMKLLEDASSRLVNFIENLKCEESRIADAEFVETQWV